MSASEGIDIERLWRRVGLQELRETAVRAQQSLRQFEQLLRALPTCDMCAKARLLERMGETGRQLSHEVSSLSMLASALQDTVRAAEGAQVTLQKAAISPCRCEQGPCTCHA